MTLSSTPSVHSPVRIGTGPSSYTVYTLSPSNIQIRYSQFNNLRKALCNQFPFTIIPVLPEKKTLHRLEPKLVKHRCTRLNSFVEKCTRNGKIRGSKIWKDFLETGSVQVGKEIKFGNKEKENDEWYINKTQSLEHAVTQLKSAAKAMAANAKAQNDIIEQDRDIAASLSALAESCSVPEISAIAKRRHTNAEQNQSLAETTEELLDQVVDQQIQLHDATKACLQNRSRLNGNVVAAKQAIQKKEDSLVKQQLSVKTREDRISLIKAEIAAATDSYKALSEEFAEVSTSLKEEIDRVWTYEREEVWCTSLEEVSHRWQAGH